MIQTTSSAAFTIYLSITLGMVMALWIYTHYRSKKRKILTNEKELFICEFCHFAYVDEQVNQLNLCPQCGLFNKRDKD